MNKLKQSSINKYSIILLVIVSIIIAICGFYVYRSSLTVTKALEIHSKVLTEVRELEKASEFLTRKARLFIVLGDSKDLDDYLEEIQTIKRIDNAIDNIESIKYDLGSELSILRKVKEISDKLILQETYSMKLKATLIEDKNNELINKLSFVNLRKEDEDLSTEKKIALANDLLFGKEYNNELEKINTLKEKYINSITSHFSSIEKDSKENSNLFFAIFIVFLFIYIFLFFATLYYFYLQIAIPIRNYTKSIGNDSANGKYDPLNPQGTYEIRELASAYNLILSEREKYIRELKQSEYKLKQHIEFMPLGAIEYNKNFEINNWNPTAQEIFGFTSQEAIGKNIIELLVPDNVKKDILEKTSNLNEWDKGLSLMINENKTKSGRIVICQWYNTLIHDVDGNIISIQSLVKDITEQKEEEKRMIYISQHDQLTKLYNRRFITEKIQEEINRSKRTNEKFSIVMIDIDYFKHINDYYGHECGDLTLIKLSEILMENTRVTDYVGRWGGEEFIILLPNTDVHGGYNVADKIRKKVKDNNFSYSGKDFNITITAGVYCYEDESIDEFIRKSDKALLKGKSLGKNMVVVEKS